jgi:hypothetical protein
MKSKRLIELEDILRVVDEWLKSKDVWIEDFRGVEVNQHGETIQCKKGSLLTRLIPHLNKDV